MTTGILVPAIEVLEGGVQAGEIPRYIVTCLAAITGAVALAVAQKMYDEGLRSW